MLVKSSVNTGEECVSVADGNKLKTNIIKGRCITEGHLHPSVMLVCGAAWSRGAATLARLLSLILFPSLMSLFANDR